MTEDTATRELRYVAVWGSMIPENSKVLYGYLQAMEDEGLLEFIHPGRLVLGRDEKLQQFLNEKAVSRGSDAGFYAGSQTIYRAYVRQEQTLANRLAVMKKRFELDLHLDLETRIYSAAP